MRDSGESAFQPTLGVARSVCGRVWRPRLDAGGDLRARAIAQATGLPDALARILSARGVAAGDAQGFLEPRLRDLMPDPSSLRDMDAAAARLADAVERGEIVALFGDYDVDGAASVALMAGHLAALGTASLPCIPDRLTEGYGPNVEAVRELKERGADLLVLLDCGATSEAPIAEAVRLGLDPIVLDHHPTGELLPPAMALVDPNRADDLSGLGHLCAAGVAFLACVALNRELRRRGRFSTAAEPDLVPLLDLVALATVADVAPLIGLNRAFVRQGLKVMRGRGRPGLRALADVARLNGPPQAYHLGFLLGPRINAGGRIGDSGLGARLLATEDEDEARAIAQTLDRLNGERQAIEQAMLDEAEALAARLLMEEPETPTLVVTGPDWHPGVVGLVASRLKERARRPVFALAPVGEGRLTGSGRSIEGVDLGAAVRAAAADGLVDKGGGHAMAAGVTLRPEAVPAFAARLRAALAEAVAASRAVDALAIDAVVTAGGATPDLIETLERAGPYGAGAPEPVFALPRHRVAEAMEVGAGHLRLRLVAGDGTAIEAIAFRAAAEPLGAALVARRGEPMHIAGTLSLDTWGGGRRPKLRVIDAAIP